MARLIKLILLFQREINIRIDHTAHLNPKYDFEIAGFIPIYLLTVDILIAMYASPIMSKIRGMIYVPLVIFDQDRITIIDQILFVNKVISTCARA